jgi:hypothetical protein
MVFIVTFSNNHRLETLKWISGTEPMSMAGVNSQFVMICYVIIIH